MEKRPNISRIKKNNRGFSIIETLVAISVLAIALTGPFMLATQSIGGAITSKNQMIASYLATEAIEYVRNVRDSNFLTQGNSWLKGLNECNNKCTVDVINNKIETCNEANCDLIKYSNNKGYNYEDGENTIFTRTIRIKNEGGGNKERKIEVTVEWTDRLASKEFTIEEHIFNWK